jgi:hypothetical protein
VPLRTVELTSTGIGAHQEGANAGPAPISKMFFDIGGSSGAI